MSWWLLTWGSCAASVWFQLYSRVLTFSQKPVAEVIVEEVGAPIRSPKTRVDVIHALAESCPVVVICQ